MVLKCAACGKFMPKDPAEGAACIGCQSSYHLACVGIQDKNKIVAGWACPECKAKVPRKNNDDTPIKISSERDLACAADQSPCMSPNDTAHDITADFSVAEELKLFREVLREELSSLRNEMQGIKRELSNVSSSLLQCNKRIDDLESSVTRVEKQFSKQIDDLESRIVSVESQPKERNGTDSTAVEAMIVQLKAELNDRDQELLLNDVDITGIPEEKGENVLHVTTLVAAKIGITLKESDIVRAERVGPVRAGRDARGGRDEVTARPIVVRLARRALRDDLLRAARVRREATTADLSLPGPVRRFYINERLTKNNRQLFNKARAAAKSCKWKFIWSRDGRIYARKNEGQSGVRIRSDQDILRIFGSENIGPNV
ncbi:uncharacterized protein LOC123865902 [Maniola jurtina]|uniref:uncharacterized protein LOC123865902 n=1 Tax=Maniola jurtina TaxID=191418 RepID=UPI001E68F851|nr:uncharacterized protein LOC123865902 [Maniola jurtina]